MAAEIIQVNTQDLTTQVYQPQDTSLISNFDISTTFTTSSYVEFFIYDNNNNVLYSDYSFTQYKVFNDGQSAGLDNTLSQITINPETDLINLGYTQGEYTTYYNFLNKQIGSSIELLYIAEISSDRTELRLYSTVLSNLDIVEKTNAFVQERESSTYFLDFYINFGDNQLLIANNIQLDNQDPTNPTVLIKLYDPLPAEFDLNSQLWVVSSIEEPVAYKVTFQNDPIVVTDTINIKGPNFNLNVKDRINNSSVELSYADLITTSLTSSQNQLNSLLEEKEIDINIDYTDFSNFVHFSSAQNRLENFYYKVDLIEQYSSSLAILNSTLNSPTAISESKASLENKINNIITNFDGYDYYLYYSTGSWPWPKTTTEQPYQLALIGSTSVTNWYNNIIDSASLYDINNKDNLYYSIPEYLRNDPNNESYELFLSMVGQHFDNIWIYYKDVTEKYNADNRLESGISKDIVADAIRNFGIKLYQNNFSNQDLYTAFLGLTPDGGLFPFPNITGSLPVPSGYEYITTKISASSDYLPLDDVNKSLYKRIYHNLPYLLKSKGTLPGLRALITSYGIPDTILRIKEFGGKDKVEYNDWDYWQDEYNYKLETRTNNFVSSSWTVNSKWSSPNNVPSSVLFRFQAENAPPTKYSQSLWTLKSSTGVESVLTLQYSGTGLTSGSYSASINDPYYQYGYLKFYPSASNLNLSASIYLPFFNNGWWSVMINSGSTGFNLYASNNIYEGGDNGVEIGFYESSNITSPYSGWASSTISLFASQSLYNHFSGSLQEIRYYNKVLNENSFKDFVMNPYSTEGNSVNSSPDTLIARLPLGGELYTGSTSVHPKVTGSWTTTSSFASNSNFYIRYTSYYTPNTEYFFYDQPAVGIQNYVSNKIRLEDNVVPSGDTLSPYRRITQQTEASASYTENINLLEVAFSPQDEINDDISSQIGYFNIGDYIGDPRLRSSSATSYPDLDRLRDDYFKKYTKNYNLFDYIRLIKYFDNSLFKMIRDFVPARTSLASGIVVKQHYLERSKYPQPQVSWEDLDLTGAIKSTQVWDPTTQTSYISHSLVETFSGGAAGMFNIFNGLETSPSGSNGTGPNNRYGITQSWNETYPSLSGSVSKINSSQDEFYNGEFSGSLIVVTTQSLHQPFGLDYQEFNYTPVIYSDNSYGYTFLNPNPGFAEDLFLNPLTVPQQGEILMLTPYSYSTPAGFKSSKTYIKVNKTDNNGINNSIPLNQVDKILLKYTASSAYISMNILSISAYPNYYLYETSPFTQTDNYIKDYKLSASLSTSPSILPGDAIIPIKFNSINYNPNSFYNSTTGLYTVPNTPNVKLTYTMSGTATSTGDPTGGTLVFNSYVTGSTSIRLDGVSISLPNTTPTSFIISGSLLPSGLGTEAVFSNSGIYFAAFNNDSVTSPTIQISGLQLQINQNATTNSADYDSVILEPYITTTNYYNSDNNPIINNAVDIRQSEFFQDVDYSYGILEPVNFDLIISGSATKATVQDSNYTTARVINPRYNGSRTTSQYLNQWTEGDINTYGKLPTIDSTKVYVAYCDANGSWAPEKLNTNQLWVKYLIDQDGNVVIPGVTPNALEIIKGTFESEEKLKIEPDTNPNLDGYRNIFRGGTTIEPILYTQIGYSPATWTSSINLININEVQSTTTYGNYETTYKIPSFQTLTSANTWYTIDYSSLVYRPNAGSWSGTHYVVVPQLVNEGVGLSFQVDLAINYAQGNGGEQFDVGNMYYTIELRRKRGGVDTTIYTQNVVEPIYQYPNYALSATTYASLFYDFLPSDLIGGDEYSIRISQNFNSGASTYNGYSVDLSPNYGQISVYQNPSPTNLNIPVGTNSIWGYANKTSYPNVITCSNNTLNYLYGNPYIKQDNVPNSGFNNITLPWSLAVGDEFRFEGSEQYVYMVDQFYIPTDNSPSRVTPTGSLEIHFNHNLPVSASTSTFNLDHFVIRRYVDGNYILVDGPKSTTNNGQGPFIVKPQYMSPKLDKTLDQYITDLTQKGLL